MDTNETKVLVTRISFASGKQNTMEIPLSETDYLLALRKWKGGELIQNAFPTLSAELREFLMSGITPDEWQELFTDEE